VTRCLLLSGGIYHPFAETSAAIAVVLMADGIQTEITRVDAGLTRLGQETFDLVAHNAMAYSMTQADKYAPLREDHAFQNSAAQQAGLKCHVVAGRGLIGLHAAAICFDTWDGWKDVLGVRWVWGLSGHPMPDYLTVRHEETEFTVWDELYQNLALHPQTKVHATARLQSGSDEEPVLTQKGSAVYLALGHDLTCVGTDHYADILRRSVAVALGKGDG